MSNELATRNNNNVAPAVAGGNPFLAAANALGGGNEGFTYLQFSGKTGDYTYGAEKEELEHGWRGAVPMASAKLGHICWNDGKVVGENMTAVVDGNPTPKNQLEDHGPYEDDGDGWSEQFSYEVVDMETGEQLLFKNSSKSGLRAFANLMAAYGKAIQKGLNYGKDGEELHPIVEFSAVDFIPNGGSKRDKAWAPKFTIVDWLSDADLDEKFGGEDDAGNYEDEEEEAPVAKAKEVEPEPEPEEAPVVENRARGRRKF